MNPKKENITILVNFKFIFKYEKKIGVLKKNLHIDEPCTYQPHVQRKIAIFNTYVQPHVQRKIAPLSKLKKNRFNIPL